MAKRRAKGTGCLIKRGGKYYYRHDAIGTKSTGVKIEDGEDAAQKAINEKWGVLIAHYSAGTMAEHVAKIHSDAADAIREAETPINAVRVDDVWALFRENASERPSKARGHYSATDDRPRAKRTVQGYKNQWERFRKHVAHREFVHEITQQDVTRFLKSIQKGRSTKTRNRYLSAIRVVITVGVGKAFALQLLADLEAKDEKKSKDTSRTVVFRTLTQREITAIEEQAKPWVLLGTVISIRTGLRLGDFITLRWDEVDETGGFIDNRNNKTAKPFSYYCPEVMPYFAQYRKSVQQEDGEEFVFGKWAHQYLGINGYNENTSYACQAYKLALKALKDDGGNPLITDLKVVGTKSLRKTAAVLKLAEMGDRQAATQLLGHSSRKVTEENYLAGQTTIEDQRLLARQLADPYHRFTDDELIAECQRRGIWPA